MFSKYCYTDGLVEIIDSAKKFFINYLGQVKDNLGNDVLISYDNDNNPVVNLTSWDGYRIYRIIDLMVIHFKDLRIPKDTYNQIKAFVIDGNKCNVQAKNIGYRFINKRLEVTAFPGFYYIPGFTINAIDKNGVTINSRKGVILKYSTTKPGKKNVKGGYKYLNSVGCNGRSALLFRHRAIGLVFIDYPDNCDSMVVNHKNGIPGDDLVDNLEWCTRGQNNFHAWENNLRNQNKPVLSRNVFTGEVKEYFSMSECARQLGYSHNGTIRNRLINSDFSKVCSDGMQFKFKDDSRGWIIPADHIEAIRLAQIAHKVKVRSCIDLSIREFDSIINASKYTNVNSTSIKYRLDNDDRSPLRGYQFISYNDIRPWPDFTYEEYLETLDPMNIDVDARNHLTGEELFFSSIKKAVKYTKKTYIAEALKSGNQPLYSDGWQFKFSKDIWIDFEDIEKELYLRTKQVMAKNEETGKIILAKSCRELGIYLSMCPKYIKKAALARGNILYNGYRFRLGFSSSPWPNN